MLEAEQLEALAVILLRRTGPGIADFELGRERAKLCLARTRKDESLELRSGKDIIVVQLKVLQGLSDLKRHAQEVCTYTEIASVAPDDLLPGGIDNVPEV